jgi:hypothetical protein
MARSPTALILSGALTGIMAGALGLGCCLWLSSGAGEAQAQQISTARVLPSTPALASGASEASAPTFSNRGAVLTPATAGTATIGTTTRPLPAAGSRRPASAGTGLAGRVTGNASPLQAAGVYAYQLADLALFKVMTDAQGNFLFRDLPAGLYKIIAHKPGFLPVVIMVTRDTAKAYQFLELQLAQRAVHDFDASDRAKGPSASSSNSSGGARKTGAADSVDGDFWALRARIPGDVLRDIEASDAAGTQEGQAKSATAASGAAPASAAGATPASGSITPAGTVASGGSFASARAEDTAAGGGSGRFHTEVQAMTGVANVAQVGVGQVSSGKLGIEGQLGQVQVGLSGRFWQMSSDSLLAGSGAGSSRAMPGTSADGKTSAMSLDLEAGRSSRITVTSLNNHLLPRSAAGQGEPVGLDHYQVSWSQKLGENSHSDFAAQYTSENNYHRQSAIDPASIPGSSRTWNFEGSYTTALGEDSSLQAGFRYRQSLLDLAPIGPAGNLSAGSSSFTALGPLGSSSAVIAGLAPDHQTVDFFTRGGTRLQPALLVEYGLYTTLLDGSVSLAPQGGLVLQLDEGWQARGSATHRVYQQSPVNPEFMPALFKESDLCEQGGKSCYELSLSHHAGEDDAISISGIDRLVGQTLRLYFSDVVFDRLESLYLVPGDRVPELHLLVSHRLTPQIKTSLESSFAMGGGGVFIGADGHPYKNQVRYLVTSLDTHFLSSATGVFLAFHHLTQGEKAVGAEAGSALGGAPVDLDRLQLMLSQDLSVLWNLAAQWALQVNMELSRGTAPFLASTDTQLHRRILGGIAVRF